MTQSARTVGAALLVLATAACGDVLKVDNEQSGNVERVFALAATIEQTLGSGYQQCRNSLHSTTGNAINIQMATMSLESYSQLNNFNMGPRGAIPRAPVLNNRSSSSVFTEFSSLSRQSRVMANALGALDKLKADGGTLGTAAQDLRARSWGFFVIGCNLGYLAITYDSAGIVSHLMPSDSIPPLSGFKEVMAAAMANLDSALAQANNAAAAGAGGFPTPALWLSGSSISRDVFIQLVRSYKARFRAANARTPAERAAVDWNAVIADAEAGIKADIMVTVGASSGWNIGFEGNQMHVDAAWHQMSPMYWGMADVSGGYDNWLSRPMTEKPYFLVVSPDLRWPQGTTRAAQQAASSAPGNYLSRPYIANRTLQDTPGDPWGTSFYNHQRFKYIQIGSQTGSFPEFLKAEVDLLAAEGYIRTGNIAAAAAKIDLTRVARGSLPALAGAVTTATQVVPGGASCVPHVPAGPNFTSTVCGTIFEAMKYEKRMELAFQAFGGWFLDARGWGDLIQNTPLHYPVPYQELDARALPFYDLGGGGAFSAARGTYGF